MTTPVLFKFLDEACDTDTLLRIRREIEGETDAYDDESDSDEEEEDVTTRVRQTSPTVFALLKKFGAPVDDFKSDWACFKAFFKTHISQIADLGDMKDLDKRLNQLADFVTYSHRILSKSLKNNYTSLIEIAKEYLTPRTSPEMRENLVELHWRKIVKVKSDVKLAQEKLKVAALDYRMNHPYQSDFDYYQTQMRKMSAPSLKAQSDLTKKDVTQLLACVEGNIANRKGENLDPTITFQTYSKWKKHLNTLGLPTPDFVLGDPKEGGLKLDEQAALQEFRESMIIVQTGRFKDSSQRDVRFGEDVPAEIMRTNAIMRRPCLIFTAEQTCKMIHQIRTYFKLTLKNRPTGIGARRELSDNVTSRDMRTHVFEPFFPGVLAHARKFKLQLGSHWFRSAAANHLADSYKDSISAVRAVSGDVAPIRQQVMRALLSHGGSVASSLSYANIDTTPARKVQELRAPLEHMVMLLQKSNELLTQQVAELTKRLDAVKPREECSDLIEFKRADGTIATVPKRNDTVRHASSAERDAAIQRAIDELKKADVSATATNIQKCGFGSETYADWKNKYPLNYTASQRKCKKEKSQLAAIKGDGPVAPAAAPVPAPVVQPAPPPVVAPRELRERGTHVSDLPTQLPFGDKVVLTKPGSTANAKRQQLKRGRETFSGPENAGSILDSDADCESGTIVAKVVKTDKGRDLPVRVCEEQR